MTLRTAKAVLLVAGIAGIATGAQAQSRHRMEREREPKQVEHPAPAVAADKRDSVVAAPSPFAGRAYWLVLAQCGGVYFKLNEYYTDVAVHARAVKPDPKLNTEYTKKLNAAIDLTTSFYDAAGRFLMADRNIERDDAVLIYDGQARAAGDRSKTIDQALAAVRSCPALYAACQAAHPKECSSPLPPSS